MYPHVCIYLLCNNKSNNKAMQIHLLQILSHLRHYYGDILIIELLRGHIDWITIELLRGHIKNANEPIMSVVVHLLVVLLIHIHRWEFGRMLHKRGHYGFEYVATVLKLRSLNLSRAKRIATMDAATTRRGAGGTAPAAMSTPPPPWKMHQKLRRRWGSTRRGSRRERCPIR